MSYHFDPKTALNTEHHLDKNRCPVCVRARKVLESHPDRTRPGADPRESTIVLTEATDFDLVSE